MSHAEFQRRNFRNISALIDTMVESGFSPVSPNDAPAQTVARAGAEDSGAANTQYGDHAPQREEAAPEEIISRNNRLAAELRKCESEITDEDDPRGYEL